MVGKQGQDTFAKYAKNLEVIHYEDAKHELYAEKDDIVLDYTENLFRFFDEH